MKSVMVDKNFQEYWVPIIYKDGKLNLEQLKKELYDYHMLLDNVPKVYMEITNGRISKPNTLAESVIAEYNDCIEDLMNEISEENS